MKNIRVKYEKGEEVKYIGHLDTITMFDRTFRRANIDLRFSQGFNPRANISFALPTSIGITSKSEYMEFEVENENISLEDVKNKLNIFLPHGFKILDINIIEDKKSLMQKVIEAEYLIKIYLEKNDNEIIQKIENIFNRDEVLIENKKNILIDIKPYILKLNLRTTTYGVDINLLGKAGSNGNLRPDLIIKVIEKSNIEILDFNITRTNLILKE